MRWLFDSLPSVNEPIDVDEKRLEDFIALVYELLGEDEKSNCVLISAFLRTYEKEDEGRWLPSPIGVFGKGVNLNSPVVVTSVRYVAVRHEKALFTDILLNEYYPNILGKECPKWNRDQGKCKESGEPCDGKKRPILFLALTRGSDDQEEVYVSPDMPSLSVERDNRVSNGLCDIGILYMSLPDLKHRYNCKEKQWYVNGATLAPYAKEYTPPLSILKVDRNISQPPEDSRINQEYNRFAAFEFDEHLYTPFQGCRQVSIKSLVEFLNQDIQAISKVFVDNLVVEGWNTFYFLPAFTCMRPGKPKGLNVPVAFGGVGVAVKGKLELETIGKIIERAVLWYSRFGAADWGRRERRISEDYARKRAVSTMMHNLNSIFEDIAVTNIEESIDFLKGLENLMIFREMKLDGQLKDEFAQVVTKKNSRCKRMIH